MPKQQKEKVLKVSIRICKADRARADKALLKQELQRWAKKEKKQINKNNKYRPLMKQKMVNSKQLKKGGKQNPIFICDYCQKEFLFSSALKLHVLVHTGQKDFHCHLCDYSCAYKGNLQSHIRRHNLKERPFKCQKPNCGAAFKQSANLKEHRLIHNKKKKRFSCLFCLYKTNEKSYLARHMKDIHPKSRPFKSPHKNGEYSAKQKSSLAKRSKIHSEKKTQISSHPNCGFKTKRNRAFKIPMETHSNREKRFKCYFCEYSSHQYGSLVVHIRQHTGETPFACHLCPYKSKQKGNLDHHMKNHRRN